MQSDSDRDGGEPSSASAVWGFMGSEAETETDMNPMQGIHSVTSSLASHKTSNAAGTIGVNVELSALHRDNIDRQSQSSIDRHEDGPILLPTDISHQSRKRQDKAFEEESWLFAAFDILIAVAASSLMQQFFVEDGITNLHSFTDFVLIFAPIYHTHWLSQEVLRRHTLPKMKFYFAMFVILLGILISSAGINQVISTDMACLISTVRLSFHSFQYLL